MGLFKRKPKKVLEISVDEKGNVEFKNTGEDDVTSEMYMRLQLSIAYMILQNSNITVEEYVSVLSESLNEVITKVGKKNE